MKFKDITPLDPRWSQRERLILEHLFRQRDMYLDAKRLFEAHGVNKSIWIIGNLLEAYCAPKPPEDKPTDFQELL